MTAKTFTYNSLRITILNGVVTESNSDSYPVGYKATAKQMTACGWKQIKAPTTYYAGGGTDGKRYAN